MRRAGSQQINDPPRFASVFDIACNDPLVSRFAWLIDAGNTDRYQRSFLIISRSAHDSPGTHGGKKEDCLKAAVM